ncbi:GIY-YIG nuclease family protein [Salinimicrobium sp. CAU 1759]
MGEFVVYVLYSKNHKKTYCGQTSNLIARFRDHNELGTKGYAKNHRPWEVIHIEIYESRPEALAREKELKSGKGREWIKKYLLKQV